jgi:acetyl esterase/lipase
MPAAEAFVQAKAMLPQGIEYLPDIEYASVLGFRPLTLELYLPADKKPTPVVVYIHGGGFELGSTRMPKTPAGDWPLVTLAARGYVMAGVAYRMTGEAKFPVAVQDVKAAIRFLRAHAAEYNLDPNRIGVWGESAGGYLTAIMATSCGAKEFEGVGENKDQSSCVQSAVDWFGPIDFAAMQTRKKPRRVRPRRARRRP